LILEKQKYVIELPAEAATKDEVRLPYLPLASGRLTITEPLLSSSSSVQVSLPLMLQHINTSKVKVK